MAHGSGGGMNDLMRYDFSRMIKLCGGSGLLTEDIKVSESQRGS